MSGRKASYPAKAKTINGIPGGEEMSWFYEGREGLIVMVRPGAGTSENIISWRRIEAAYKRHLAIKKASK